MGDDDEGGLQAVRRLEETAEEDTLGGRRLRRQEHSPRSQQAPTSAPPVRNLPSRPNISTSSCQSSNPRSSQPHTPVRLLLPPGAVALASSLAMYSLNRAPAMIHGRLGGPAFAPEASTCMPVSLLQPLPIPQTVPYASRPTSGMAELSGYCADSTKLCPPLRWRALVEYGGRAVSCTVPMPAVN